MAHNCLSGKCQGPPEPFAVKAQQAGKNRRGRGKVKDVEIIGRLAQQHAGGGGAVAGPIPDGGIERLGEVKEVRDVRRRSHERQRVEHAEPHAHAADHPRPPAAGLCRNDGKKQRQGHDVAAYDIVEPHTAQKGGEARA